MQKLAMLFTKFLDMFFPRTCSGCALEGTLLCAKCLAKVPSAPSVEHSFIHAVFDYRHSLIKNAIWRFKYKNTRNFAEVFSEKLYEEILGYLGESLHVSSNETFLLIPIPLHKKRLHERGYNQSELLARAVLTHDTANLFELAPNLLVRTRATKPQARSEKRTVRLMNLRGAFACPDPAHIRGRIVILIDDVSTTGATLLEAKRALASAKPREVLAFAVAH